MDNQEIISLYYKEAVRGLNKVVLEDKDLWYSYVINLPLNIQITYTLVVFHQQVFNGGLHQYFFNSYGQFAYDTIDHLRLVNAFKTADILERAIRAVNLEELSINDFRNKIFNRELHRIVDFEEELVSYLELLDDEYYKLDENLENLLGEFIASERNGISNHNKK